MSQNPLLQTPSSGGGGEDLKKKRRSVNWDPEDQDDNGGIFIPSKGDITEGFEISQWPSADAIAEKRRSSMNMNHPSKLTTKLKRCCSKRRIPINGVLEGPIIEIDTGIHPIDYFSSYSGSIQAKATAIVGWDGRTSYTYEELNCYSDHFAVVLKPLVEEQLKLEYYESLDDYEPCVGVALNPCEKCVITILAIWKLGLAYLPLRTSTDPEMRITGIIHSIKPLLVIGMSEDETLPHITSDGWRSIHFEHFWDQVKSKKSILSTSERSELVVSSLSSAFAHSPQSMCSAILHRINSRAEVIPVFIRNATIWNRVYAEWTHFPYHNDENVALYSSIDSPEFLGQMLSSLLAGRRIISIDIHDLYGLVERVEQWKIMRLTTFPQLMYGIICTMVVIKMKCPEESPSTSLDSVKYWFCTGGSLRRALAVQFFKNVQPGTYLVSLFGCMETLDFVSFQVFKSLKDIKSCLYYKIIPMGSPVINTRLYIVDPNGKIMTGSGHGELYVSGLSVTSNPEKMQTIHMLDDGPIIKPNPFFNEVKDNSIFKMVVKSRDFGRMVYNVNNRGEACCGHKHLITTVFSGHTEGTSIMENYRVNTNEMNAYLKRCPGVKGCHVMVYRPGTNSKMILAFIVMSIKNPMTKDEVYKYLQARIPGYMMPTLIFISGIPVKNFKINTNTLVEYFHKERISKNQATNYVELGFQPRELKAVESLMKILFYYCGSNKRWVASHMNFTLDELRIPYTKTPKVLIELTRRGYSIEMQEFFRLKTPQEILDLMMKRSPPPLINGQIFDKSNNYQAEVIDGKHRKELMELFISGNCGVQYTYSIAYYSGMREEDMEHVIKHIWPLLVQKKFGVTVRCNKTRKLVAALLNCDHIDKTKFKQWAGISYPSKYRMEMIDQMDLVLEQKGLINKADQLNSLQTLFLVYDPKKTNWDYRQNIYIFQTMLAKALELARGAGFKSMYLMVFDHVSEEFVVDLFGFEVIEIMHVNQFVSSDGVIPFHLVPDYVCGTVLYKKL